jgi:hypothetical protein
MVSENQFEHNKRPVWDHPVCTEKPKTFTDALVTPDGYIVSGNDNIYQNCGCSSSQPVNLTSLKHTTTVKYENVVSIAAYWGYGMWHFVAECLPGLQTTKHILHHPETYLHINRRNKVCLGWLEFFEFPLDRVIEGNIIAKNLTAPPLGQCGEPYYNQVIWLRDNIYQLLGEVTQSRLCILVKRASRGISNHTEVEDLVRRYCDNNNIDLHIFDDRDLPTVREQLTVFAKASIIVAPHGAGSTNILACNKECKFIEINDNSRILSGYDRLAHLLNIDYVSIRCKGNWMEVPLTDLKAALTI